MSGNGYEFETVVLQLLDKKKMKTFDENDTRYRLAVSDGVNLHRWTTVATALNGLIVNIPNFSIIKLGDYQTPDSNKYETDLRYSIV